MKRVFILDLITYLLVLLFFYTGFMKISDLFYFKGAMEHSQILAPYASVLSWIVPIAELLVVVALLIPKTKKLGLYASLLLMTLFTIYVGYVVFFMKAIDRPCLCGGIIQQMSWYQHFYFNTFFTLLTVTGIVLERKVSDNHAAATKTIQYQPF